MLVLFAAAGAAAVWNFVRPSEDPWTHVGRIEDFPPGTVTSFADTLGFDGRDGFHIVRLDDGELLALRDKDPHLGCAVPYRPDFVWDGRPGWFRNPCHGETFDHGRPARLRPLAARSRPHGYRGPRRSRVHRSARDHAGARQPPDGYEFQTGGTLLPPRRY